MRASASFQKLFDHTKAESTNHLPHESCHVHPDSSSVRCPLFKKMFLNAEPSDPQVGKAEEVSLITFPDSLAASFTFHLASALQMKFVYKVMPLLIYFQPFKQDRLSLTSRGYTNIAGIMVTLWSAEKFVKALEETVRGMSEVGWPFMSKNE